MIEAAGLGKSFGRTMAVEDVTFTADDGLVTGVLGPNGAGKTTTLRALAGLVRPDRGSARLDGVDIAVDAVGARRRLGVLPESVGLYDRLTVREHLEYAGRLQGVEHAGLTGRVQHLVQQMGLARLAERRAGALSLGERRRVALARALVHEPQNVILDEPTNGLDVLGTREVRAEIRRLAAAGRAVLVSSHVMPEVAALCDRVVVLARGRVVAQGSPAELVARAASASLEDAFVRLIGSEEGLN